MATEQWARVLYACLGPKAELCRLCFTCVPFLMQRGEEITATPQTSGPKQIASGDSLGGAETKDTVPSQSKYLWGRGICRLSPHKLLLSPPPATLRPH